MIAEGRVALNGTILDTPATILRNLNGVTVDGDPVEAPSSARLFLYHKPTGLLVTERDPAGRTTIYDRLPRELPRLVPVGRLDLNTEGLLLMTTDGGLKRQLELPATGVERAYRARAYGNITQPQLEELIEGIEIEGVRYGSINANIERRTGANVWIEMILTEGKNREVRRVLEHLGLQVSRLIRTRYGPFVLGDLAPGQIGEVLQHDVVAFQKELAKGKPEGPARARTSGSARVRARGPGSARGRASGAAMRRGLRRRRGQRRVRARFRARGRLLACVRRFAVRMLHLQARASRAARCRPIGLRDRRVPSGSGRPRRCSAATSTILGRGPMHGTPRGRRGRIMRGQRVARRPSRMCGRSVRIAAKS
ncbi:pseudouridine synthase [Sphingomonas sp. 22L2VL55-3]